MKKNYLIILALISAVQLFAQDSGLPPTPYKPEELKRWSSLCSAISQAVPSAYKDYSVKKEDCNSFEWTERDSKHQSLTVRNKRNEPIGNNPYFTIWYSKNQDSADLEAQKITEQILDIKNPDGTINTAKLNLISAQSEKFEQTRTLRIYVATNVVVDYQKQYYKDLKPEKIDLPVPAFGYLYLFPNGKEVREEGGSLGTDAMSYYKDKALIVLSTKPPKTTSTSPENCTWKEDSITPQDNAPENIMAPVKNIFIDITGAENDVRAIIKQIDWKALQSLLGK